jgi:hypothetical protein
MCPQFTNSFEHAGIQPAAARIVVMPFDKLDVEKGMEIVSPSGSKRWVRQPWSVLAYQIAGDEGLRILHEESVPAERPSPPAENLLVDLLKLPAAEGLGTLILIDELLMFARQKVGLDPSWKEKLQDFFQALTQAVTKVNRCAIVASLLATDPRKSDELGKQLTGELYAVFGRLSQQNVQPVGKEDVAEVLRRRFFTPDSIAKRDAFRATAFAAVDGIISLEGDEGKAQRAKLEEEFLRSYPFHPGLTDVLYTKWTQLENFQRTRGLLRTFALALRDAESWDQSPVISVECLLATTESAADRPISDALRELVTVAGYEEYEGRRHDWATILEGELAKARDIQTDFTGLGFRELEEAVVATFLHSQPLGQTAKITDLLTLVGVTRPDRIQLEKGLRRWAQTSWFLDEDGVREATESDSARLPQTWRLGSRPNLTQIHDGKRGEVPADEIEAKLIEEIGKASWLVKDAEGAGAVVHRLPASPADVKDDGAFHYVVLGPKAAASPGRPSTEAVRYLTDYTGPERPRVYKNAIVLVVPSVDGVMAAREAVRDVIGWDRVRKELKSNELDEGRKALLDRKEREARASIGSSIQQGYCLAITLDAQGKSQALKVTGSEASLFLIIKADKRVRLLDSEINPEAILPGGPYGLWREGENERWATDLYAAFTQDPKLPKLLRPKQIVQQTLRHGCNAGTIVLRVTRSDRSERTLWRQNADAVVLDDQRFQAILPSAATLTEIDAVLLTPGKLPQLWQGETLSVAAAIAYFAGPHEIPNEGLGGYVESIAIPNAPREVVLKALEDVVKSGQLWLISGLVGFCGDSPSRDLFTDEATLRLPPVAIRAIDILPLSLPLAWNGDRTTPEAILAALSDKLGEPLPWKSVVTALDDAFGANLLERITAGIEWPCDRGIAHALEVGLVVHKHKPGGGKGPEKEKTEPTNYRKTLYFSSLGSLQGFLDDKSSDLSRAVAGNAQSISVTIEIGERDLVLKPDLTAKLDSILDDEGERNGLAAR